MKRAYFQTDDVAWKFWLSIPYARRLPIAQAFREYKGGHEVLWRDK